VNVLDKSEYVKPFLFPHGNLKTDILKVELSKENLTIEEVLVYDTLPNPSIERDLLECTDRFTTIPEFLVFFSPSGLHSSLEYLRKIPVDLNLVKVYKTFVILACV
jgi:uroporphyrinogen-III synthase